jgi:GT2 family glycosyltransferase
MQRPTLSIVIVTWNGRRHLPECLAALRPQLPPDAELILVDNGSADGTVAWARASAPELRIIELAHNHGFAGGVNAGLRAARGELLLLINDDAFAEPGFLAALLAAATALPEVGAFAAVLTFNHRPELVASAGIRLRRDGLALDLWPGRAVSELPHTPLPIAGPSGGAALYRRTLLEDIGLMEASFFNYLEDADLVWRSLLRGWRSVVVPQARARHVYSATGGYGSPFKQRLLGRNRYRTIIRCIPGALLLRCLPAILLYEVLATGHALLRGHHAAVAGRIDALKELPRLLSERRALQHDRRASHTSIAAWLEPPPLPWVTLREQQQLDTILRQREQPE